MVTSSIADIECVSKCRRVPVAEIVMNAETTAGMIMTDTIDVMIATVDIAETTDAMIDEMTEDVKSDHKLESVTSYSSWLWTTCQNDAHGKT